jgi:hypothetical protein
MEDVTFRYDTTRLGSEEARARGDAPLLTKARPGDVFSHFYMIFRFVHAL